MMKGPQSSAPHRSTAECENVKTMQSNPARGFTLLELLVVIAIITILASLLLPTLSRAKKASQSARCKSNLRQQGLALNLHVSEFGAYPMDIATGEIPELESPHWGTGLWHLNYWFVQLDAQMRDSPGHTADALFDRNYIFRCPADPRGKLPSPFSHDLSYGYNKWGVRQSGPVFSDQVVELGLGGVWNSTATKLAPCPETTVSVPSDMIAIADKFAGAAPGYLQSTFDEINRDLPYPPLPEGQPDYGTEQARKRHGGALNVLFCDDHVEALKLKPLFFDRSDAALRPWNKDNEPHRERLP